jgi:hypothetical protein
MRASAPRRGTLAIPILVLLTLVIAGPDTRAGGKGSSEYDLSVQVAYGREVGPESLREQLEMELVREIAEKQCFASVDDFDPRSETQAGDLLLRLVIQDVKDHTEWEVSLAYRDRREGMPDDRQRQVTLLEVKAALQLLTLPEMSQVRRDDFKTSRGYRPQFGEDAKHEVRQLMLKHLAEEGRRFACKWSPKKLAREVERARSQAAPASSESR